MPYRIPTKLRRHLNKAPQSEQNTPFQGFSGLLDIFKVNVGALSKDPEHESLKSRLLSRFGQVQMPQLPPSTVVDLNKANQLRQANRHAEALEILKRVARQVPDNARIQHDLGMSYLQHGQASDAVDCFRAAISMDPRFAHAHYGLGISFNALGRAKEALSALEEAVGLRPRFHEAQGYRAEILLKTGRNIEAAAAFWGAAKAAGKTFQGHLWDTQGALLEGRDDDAEKFVKRAIALNSSSYFAQWQLGTIQADSGRFVEAEASFAQSIKLNPRQGSSYYDLVHCRTCTEIDRPLLAQMLSVAKLLDSDERVRLELAIGKVFEDLSDYETAMFHYDRAGKIKKGMVHFQRDQLMHRVNLIIARYNKDFFAKHNETANPSQLPILIVGLPRSGTTLVEQMLSCHPKIEGAGELLFWNRRGQMFDVMAEPEIPEFQIDTARSYLIRLQQRSALSARVSDKNPFNFLELGAFHLVFPQAKIIHCRRNLVDTCVSIYSNYFRPRADFSTAPEDLVFYAQQYQKMMEHWRGVLPSSCFLEVDYEQLVDEPEPVMRRVLSNCGISWDRACLSPESNGRRVKTASKWQARQPVHSKSVSRWRNFEPWLGPFNDLR